MNRLAFFLSVPFGLILTLAARAQEPPPAPAPVETSTRLLVPGTRVRLTPPPGHAPGQGFFGFQWEKAGASLVVTEFPGPYAQVSAAFDKAELAKKGMKLRELRDVKLDGRAAKLASVSQTERDIQFSKWMLLTGDEKSSVMLVATFPTEYEDQLSAKLESALLGASWDPNLEVDPFAVLPWTIDKPLGLKFASQMGTALIFTEDGQASQKDKPTSPRLLIAPSMGQTTVTDARAFAERRLRQMPNLTDLEIQSSFEFSAGGRKGWELCAKATDKSNDVALFVHQVVLVGDDEYHLFLGQCGYEARETWSPRFRDCAKSWKLKSPPK